MVTGMAATVPPDGSASPDENASLKRRACRIAICIATPLLVWLTTANGLAGIAESSNPKMAQQIAPFDSRANAALADLMLQSSGTGEPHKSAADYARRAIARGPLSISAYRVLGLMADSEGRPRAASALLHYAGRLSRRDFGTQLWLIQDAVNRNDAAAALAQFDVTLRAIPGKPCLLVARSRPRARGWRICRSHCPRVGNRA